MMTYAIRKYPRGATHCVYPTAMDEIFYRKSESGKGLEVFAMGRGEWFASIKEIEFLDTIHKLEL